MRTFPLAFRKHFRWPQHSLLQALKCQYFESEGNCLKSLQNSPWIGVRVGPPSCSLAHCHFMRSNTPNVDINTQTQKSSWVIYIKYVKFMCVDGWAYLWVLKSTGPQDQVVNHTGVAMTTLSIMAPKMTPWWWERYMALLLFLYGLFCPCNNDSCMIDINTQPFCNQSSVLFS